MSLSGEVAIVTGCGRGIGRAIAERLAREGANIVANDILPEQLEDTVLACRAAGSDAVAVEADIVEPSTSERLVAIAIERFGRLDVVVNNAFWARTSDFLDQSAEEWARILDVSLNGAVLLSRAALPLLTRQGSGAIVNVASIHSLGAGRRYAAYEVAKTGLVGLTRAVAAEFGRDGVRCNAVCPGLVITERNAGWWSDERVEWVSNAYPLGRVGTAAEVAAAVAFLASNEAAFIAGVCLPVDGGLSAILPEVPALRLYDAR